MKRILLLTSGLLGTSIALIIPPAYSAADITQCRSIADSQARLACYDQAVDSETATLEEQVVETDPESVAAEEAGAPSSTPYSDRIAQEAALVNNAFVLTPHYRNYILPVTYNDKINERPFTDAFPGVEMDDVEAKFQISFKVRLAENLIGDADLWAGYTQQNWWQVYNDDESAPFRETNYEPEALLAWENDWKIAGLTNTNLTFGFNHQSNGRGDLLSRSWNRIIVGAAFERQNFAGRVRAWHRIEESDSDDDNPDTEDYYGYGDVMLAYHWGDHDFATVLRNNLQSGGDNKGAIQLDWTYPMTERFNWYIQYFYGYGESMIDYDEKSNRIGVGFAMNNLF
jgi:phospholipase A1/A2